MLNRHILSLQRICQFVPLCSIHHNMNSKASQSSDGLPSYSESVPSPEPHFSPSYLPQNIAAARTALVSSLLSTYITPHLHQSALSGISCTTLILVPSNVSSLHPSGNVGPRGPTETIVGFPSADNLTMLHLHGYENSVEFWRQLAVLQELGQQLRTHLRMSGYQVTRDSGASHQGSSPPNAEWRTVQEKTLGDGEVRVRVETMEICLRAENDMGLYETRTGKAIVVKVNVGG